MRSPDSPKEVYEDQLRRHSQPKENCMKDFKHWGRPWHISEVQRTVGADISCVIPYHCVVVMLSVHFKQVLFHIYSAGIQLKKVKLSNRKVKKPKKNCKHFFVCSIFFYVFCRAMVKIIPLLSCHFTMFLFSNLHAPHPGLLLEIS